jgi:hypothetical protein
MSPGSILCLGLLLNIRLSTSLRRFSRIVELLVMGLPRFVPSQAREGTADCPRDSVAHARPKILDLPLCFLCLTFLVLTDALFLETLCAKGSADEFFAYRVCVNGC